jgi:hypothetical protein
MNKLYYAVNASMPEPGMAGEYIAWLNGGHAAEVVRGGALTAMVVRLDDAPGGPARVMTAYTFESRQAFARYERETAPRLRAEGVQKFGTRGVGFERLVGEVVG